MLFLQAFETIYIMGIPFSPFFATLLINSIDKTNEKHLLSTMSSFPLSVMGQEPTGKSQWIYPDASGKLVYKTTKKVIASLIFPCWL